MIHQASFMWLMKDYAVIQSTNGIVMCSVSDNVDISHNYKKRNEVQIIFKDTQDRYKVDDGHQLTTVLSIIHEHKAYDIILRDYCQRNLTKV